MPGRIPCKEGCTCGKHHPIRHKLPRIKIPKIEDESPVFIPPRFSYIGADLSASSLYLACIEGRKVFASARLFIDPLSSSLAVIREWLRTIVYEYAATRLYCEKTWVNGRHFPWSGLMLTRTATVLEVVAAELGLEFNVVHPLSWRKLIYGKAKLPNPKQRALQFVNDNFDYKVQMTAPKGHTPDHNIAEAICIAYYGSRAEAMGPYGNGY